MGDKKNHEYFIKTGCTKNKDQLRTLKPLYRANFCSIDKRSDLTIEMLSYKLTEVRLANRRNPLSFLKKTNDFK